VVGLISRFVDQKGFDLLVEAAEEILAENLQIVALGTGMPEYEEVFLDLAARYPRQVAVRISYDNGLAHKIEAGADLFLMPSRYEPCGLNQIYSLRYGTLPLVRATGGLDDTVEPYDPKTGEGTGSSFRITRPRPSLPACGRRLPFGAISPRGAGSRCARWAGISRGRASAARYVSCIKKPNVRESSRPLPHL